MAITTDVKLSRCNGQPWGIRLSGGLDFAFPLTVVKVAIGSLAHAAGLQAGDIIVRLNGEPINQLTHAQVHDKLVNAGNDIVLSVMRGYEIAQRQRSIERAITKLCHQLAHIEHDFSIVDRTRRIFDNGFIRQPRLKE